MTEGSETAPLSGKTVTILTPMRAPARQAGISSSMPGVPPGRSTGWWWRTGRAQPSRNASRSFSTSPG
jgi:hypothetical protein